MKLRDVVSRVIIDARKLTDYALDPQNPIGRHKAEIFARSLSFTRINCCYWNRSILKPWMLTPTYNALTSTDNITVLISK